MIINGGTIIATGREYSAGIGGASYDPDFGNGGNITITGGYVTATGSDGVPSIGGGYKAGSDGSLMLSSADVLDSNTTLGLQRKVYHQRSSYCRYDFRPCRYALYICGHGGITKNF